MRNLKCSIQYDGARYRGWQRLSTSDKTIQGKIESVLSQMTGERIQLIGAGRTDAGVHALHQVANFTTRSMLHCDQMLTYCNRYLPEDIVVKEIAMADPQFHARHHARSKTYLCRLWNAPVHDVFLRKYSLHVPEQLAVDCMEKAASYFMGKHDFRSFTTSKLKKKSMVREIFNASIEQQGAEIKIVFTGDGFLYNMVRIMVGTLLQAGRHEIAPEAVPEIIKKGERAYAGPTVPPHGLFLVDIEY
jgi:tRNA pseudouridine38-40 synthase